MYSHGGGLYVTGGNAYLETTAVEYNTDIEGTGTYAAGGDIAEGEGVTNAGNQTWFYATAGDPYNFQHIGVRARQVTPQPAPGQTPPELRYLATIEAGTDPVIIYEFR